mgnify:CR=1 FL=1
MSESQTEQLDVILQQYDPSAPRATADGLRALWLQSDPVSMVGIKAELREEQETIGIPVPVLKAIGKRIAKAAQKEVDAFWPLAQLLWDEYGREGRVIAVILMGKMQLTSPEKVMPLLRDLCATCVTWEDADRFAMDALEPIVRKKPQEWLGEIEPWLEDESKWVRRAGVTVIGRLPMKHPQYTVQCLALAERLLYDEDTDVKKAVSFAIRLAARGEIEPVRDFLAQHIPPQNPVATWVLCDVIRSMTKSFLPEFLTLLPEYTAWGKDETLSAQERRSIESAIKTLGKTK